MDKTKMAKSKTDTKPFIVSVEGNIGSGKSTMLKYFDSLDNVQLFPEPVKEWTDLGGHNLLGKLYEDPTRWSFQFQSYVQLTRLKILKEPVTQGKTVKIIERSIQNNRYCFLKLASDLGSLANEELAVLNEWHDWLESNLDLGLDLIVYLRTDPEVAYRRMRQRNRSEEASAGLDYLSSLHEAYEQWLIHKKFGKVPAPVLVLDANEGIDVMNGKFECHKDFILGDDIMKENITYDTNISIKA